jgi:D-amino-acid dehydrogenase
MHLMRTDVVVLGAGIVGVSIALHLQKRGRSVLLVDKRQPGLETSFGNAGLIQREGVFPYGFPHDFAALFRYALNNTTDAHYHLSALPRIAPFLFQYWRYSRPARHRQIAQLYAPLIEHCIAEHMALAREANATDLIPPDRLDQGLPDPQDHGRGGQGRRGDLARVRHQLRRPRPEGRR